MKLIGVILAAGNGVRLLPFTRHYPKPLLPIANEPLMAYQIRMMKSAGIEEIIIVIGHLGFQIAGAIGDGSRFGVKIRYVEQEKRLGIAHALYSLESEIDSAFLLFLGDIFFLTRGLDRMIAHLLEGRAQAVLATKPEKDPAVISRNFAVIKDDEGRVRRVVEKPRYSPSHLKGCGLYLFNQDFFDALRRTPRTAIRDEYELTDAIQIYIDDGARVLSCNVIEADMNLTYPEDLLHCNLRALEQRGLENLVAKGVDIPAGTQVKNSVIGEGVILPEHTRFENVVIFDHSPIDPEINSFSGLIITPFQTIRIQ